MKKVYVSVTIDVENPQTPLFEKRFSDNRIWSDGHGIEKIIEILNKRDIKGSFFCDIYEYVIWGRTEINKVLHYISENGHDVELHTHPIWIDEKRRENMFQFPLAEQVDIIQFGVEFIENCVGKKPVCHRAGAYGFDQNTIKACAKNNILIDSSNFYNHPNCKTNLTQNELVKSDGVVEAPVTFYQTNGQIIKTDLDWIEEDDFWTYYEAVKQDKKLNFINLFMHSYSLTETHDNYNSFVPNIENENKLENILYKLKQDTECDIIPLSEISVIFEYTQ